jgi:hypothetical protein
LYAECMAARSCAHMRCPPSFLFRRVCFRLQLLCIRAALGHFKASKLAV